MRGRGEEGRSIFHEARTAIEKERGRRGGELAAGGIEKSPTREPRVRHEREPIFRESGGGGIFCGADDSPASRARG